MEISRNFYESNQPITKNVVFQIIQNLLKVKTKVIDECASG